MNHPLLKNLDETWTLLLQLYHNTTFLENFDNVKNVIVDSLKNGGRLYIAGNGGSFCDSSHFSGELVGKYKDIRKALPAENLGADGGILTCIANDFGYSEVFRRQLESKMTMKDVFIAFSTSGNSSNIVTALQFCHDRFYPSVLLSGETGGKALDFAQYSILVPSKNTAIIQQVHQIIYHSLVEAIENEI